MGDWQQAAENIVKHANGTYYLRAKVLGKVIRVSLKTKDLRIAKIKRDDRLTKERAAAVARKPNSVRTIREALAILRTELVDRPDIEEKTKSYGKDMIRILTETLPVDSHGRTWSRHEAAMWWSKVGKKYSASVSNKLLSAAKRLAAIMIAHGVRHDDPTSELKRMRGKTAHRKMPSRADMDAIISHIRNQKKRLCLESSRMVAFMAFSGARHGEAKAFTTEQIQGDRIVLGSDGNTKGKNFRMVPINGPLRALLEEMTNEIDDGPLFTIGSPRRALGTACASLDLPKMRIHDLRHFFATWAIESGVDIPTVAKWLGHKDGGALAMKTYGHVRDDHSLEAVKKMR